MDVAIPSPSVVEHRGVGRACFVAGFLHDLQRPGLHKGEAQAAKCLAISGMLTAGIFDRLLLPVAVCRKVATKLSELIRCSRSRAMSGSREVVGGVKLEEQVLITGAGGGQTIALRLQGAPALTGRWS